MKVKFVFFFDLGFSSMNFGRMYLDFSGEGVN